MDCACIGLCIIYGRPDVLIGQLRMTGPSLICQCDYFSSAAVIGAPSLVSLLLPYFSTVRMSCRQFPSPFSAALAKSVMRRGAARLAV